MRCPFLRATSPPAAITIASIPTTAAATAVAIAATATAAATTTITTTVQLIAEIEQASALLATEDNDFLIRMGVSRKLLTDVMYKQQAVRSADNPTTRYCLSQEEVRRYNVMPEERAG